MFEIRAISTSGILGYGFPEESLERCIEKNPHFIACDAGSTDAGPHYLGSEESFVSRASVKRDLELILKASRKLNIPVIIGSAGGSGSNKGVDDFREIVNEISKENNFFLKVAWIYSELDHAILMEKFISGKIKSLGSLDELNEDKINSLDRTVGMMGPEPIIKSLELDVDIIITGRATDASVFASYPIWKGCNPDTAWHAAKIIECGAATAFPKSHDCIMAYIRNDDFIIETPNPNKTLPWKNVAAHNMYENTSPFHLYEPGGLLDTTEAKYEQVTDKKVRVFGSKFITKSPYTIKLEGVTKEGYRSICFAGIRDPILINELDDYLEFVKKELENKIKAIDPTIRPGDYNLKFHRYGVDGVLGPLEFVNSKSHEIALLIDLIADTPERSKAFLAAARTLVLHSHYNGRLTISGNVAFPFSPPDIYVGEVYQFSLNHVVELEDPNEFYQVNIEEVGI
ncbi:acyclic terpene utilization AtuA family protein [Virgibacillus oceani]